jgi:very-short-patch-repair endonuclease
MTDVENKLWFHLKQKQLGLKFRRQYQIMNYIVDFVCLENNLIIELDGSQHASQEDRDKERDHKLQTEGFRVLRIWNNDILVNMDGVLQLICQMLRDHNPHPTLPLKRGGKK